MGKNSGNQHQSRSRSPRNPPAQFTQNIPELSRPQVRDTPISSQAVMQDTLSITSSPQGAALLSSPEVFSLNDQPVNLGALRTIASDIKDTLAAAIADLKLNIQSMGIRMDKMEELTERHEADIQFQKRANVTLNTQLQDMQRHMEDLDNRGCRHNLLSLTQTTRALFNDLLGRPPEAGIEFERIHRALRARGRETDPPRDVICCLISFRIKEDILRRARERGEILLQGHTVKFFQDLSPITLQKRRDLRPLLDLLRSKSITYRWKFPFCLAASYQGRTALLRSPEDLHTFCDILNIQAIDLPAWGNPYEAHPIRRTTSMDTIPERESINLRRRRSPSPGTSFQDPARVPGGGSPTAPPVQRRPRHDN